MRHRLLGSCLVAALAAASVAHAHHGWGSYDAARKVSITSPIERVDWQNPHVMVVVSYQDKAWDAVLAPPFRMSTRGLDADMLKPGTTITLEGYPSTRSGTEMRAERLIAGGRTYELR
ncbi:MAG: DUF6152 family protein [Microvirga sp.]